MIPSRVRDQISVQIPLKLLAAIPGNDLLYSFTGTLVKGHYFLTFFLFGQIFSKKPSTFQSYGGASRHPTHGREILRQAQDGVCG